MGLEFYSTFDYLVPTIQFGESKKIFLKRPPP